MSWDPDGIVVGDAFREYVEKSRESASDGDKVHSDKMTQTDSGTFGGVA